MNFRKLLVTLLVVFACPALGAAQDKICKAKLSELPQIPELSKFHLGMSREQVKALVPQVRFGRANEFGVRKTSISPDYDPAIDKTHFADVRTISLDFLDDNLTSIWIGFDGSFKWKTADEFIGGISRELSVPAEWTTKGRSQQLNCADFQLSVSMIAGGPSLRIVNTLAESTIAARRQASEDAAEAADNTPTPVPVIADSTNKFFYPADCAVVKSVPEKNRVAFNSSTEAEKAGYRLGDGCQ